MSPEQLAARLARASIDKPRVMAKVVTNLERLAKRRAPVKRGTLRRSITHRVEAGGDRGIVGTNLDYAKPVHEGSKPHIIRPKAAKMLRFQTAGGAVVYTKMVRHPGTRPNPFLKNAMQDGRGDTQRYLREAGLKMFSEIAG